MDCRETRRKLSAYQDGELADSQRAQVEQHLKQCSACSMVFQQMNQLWDIMENVETIESAPYFWTRLAQRLHERSKPKVAWRPFFAPVQKVSFSLLVICLLVLGFAIGMFLGHNIYHQSQLTSAAADQELDQVFPMNSFEDFPEQSMAQAYVTMISENSH